MSNTTEIQKVNVTEITATMALTSQVLVANETLSEKAVNGAKQLLDTIDAEGMTEDIDAALNTWQTNAKKATEIMNKRRSPITQIMSKMTKMFTTLENDLDPTKPESWYSKVQEQRNKFAKEKALEAKKKADAILAQQNLEKERISIVSDIQIQIRKLYSQKLLAFRQAIQNAYNQLTLENSDEIKKSISVRPNAYPIDKFREFNPSVFTVYIGEDELKEIIYSEREKLYAELSADFTVNMDSEKANALELIPSRLKELKAIADAGEAEKKRLEDLAEQRKKDADALLQKQAAEQAEKDKKTVASNAQMETATTLFTAAAALAEVKDETKGKSKEGYKINVLNAGGWGAIFMFYFEKEGATASVEDLGKKTMNQMKTFCEKYALKNEEFIDNDYVVYEEVYKAVVTKAA